jgi:hypothetical protein
MGAENPGIYPESMKPTRASNIPIVREANLIIGDAAQEIYNAEWSKSTPNATASIHFLRDMVEKKEVNVRISPMEK